MATDKRFVEYILDQIVKVNEVTFKKMFGEYAIYVNDKIVALLCDNQLFVKPTVGGRALIGNVEEAPPYPGAKMCLLIKDRIEDSEWLSELIRVTAGELPEPKLTRKKKGDDL